MVDRLARVVAVLQMQDDDTKVLLAAITAAAPSRRVVLTGQQEQAVRRYLARVVDAGTEGKPVTERALARYVALGSSSAE